MLNSQIFNFQVIQIDMSLLKSIPTVFFVFFSLLSTTSGFWDGRNGKIGQFPYNVFITLINVSTFHCNGALLSDQWVITAGSCLYGTTEFRIDLGALDYTNTSEDGRIFDITSEVFFPSKKLTGENDIALLKLTKKINFTETIQPVNLPKLAETINEAVVHSPGRSTITGTVLIAPVISYEERMAYTSGWKANDKITNGNYIQYIQMRIMSNSECQDKFPIPNSVFNTSICAIGGVKIRNLQSVCPEDRGAPLVLQIDSHLENRTLVGIHQHTAFGCPQFKPQIFTRITSCLQWIKYISGLE